MSIENTVLGKDLGPKPCCLFSCILTISSNLFYVKFEQISLLIHGKKWISCNSCSELLYKKKKNKKKKKHINNRQSLYHQNLTKNILFKLYYVGNSRIQRTESKQCRYTEMRQLMMMMSCFIWIYAVCKFSCFILALFKLFHRVCIYM